MTGKPCRHEDHRLGSEVSLTSERVSAKERNETRGDLTNEKNQSICWCFGEWFSFDSNQSHTRDDRADKVYIKYGVNIDKMEDHSQGQETETREGCHDGQMLGICAFRNYVELEYEKSKSTTISDKQGIEA